MMSIIDRWCKLAVCSFDYIYKFFIYLFCWSLIGICYILCLISDGLVFVVNAISDGIDYLSDVTMDWTDEIMSQHFKDWKKG